MRSRQRPVRGFPATALAVAGLGGLVTLTLTAGCTQQDQQESPSRAESGTPSQRGTISVPAGSPSPLPVSATASPAEGQRLRVEVNDLRADGRGLAVLRFTLVNVGSRPFAMDRNLADPNRNAGVGYDFFSCELATSGVTLADGDERYQPVYRTDGESRYCMNARWGGQHAGTAVEPGHGRILYTTYVLPEDLRTVTVEVPGFEPVSDIPVTR